MFLEPFALRQLRSALTSAQIVNQSWTLRENPLIVCDMMCVFSSWLNKWLTRLTNCNTKAHQRTELECSSHCDAFVLSVGQINEYFILFKYISLQQYELQCQLCCCGHSLMEDTGLYSYSLAVTTFGSNINKS